MVQPPRLLVAASAALFLIVIFRAAPPVQAVSQKRETQSKAAVSNDEKTARDLCTPCHKFPEPDILPRNMWRSEIVKMMFIMRGEPQPTDWNTVRLPEDFAATDRYMEAHAPEHLPAPDPWPDPSESPVKFTSYGLSVPNMPDDPAVSNVNLVDYDGDGKLDVLGTEMQLGIVFWGQLRPETPLKVIADVPNPDHITLTDVDKDGIKDLLIADLGRFLPSDHHDGAIVFMRGLGEGKYSGFTMEGWPRIADVESADFNGDGKNDLVVSAFGWRSTGYIAILENQSADPAHPSFEKHVIDPRPGAIHVIPVDLNKDGKMDFVALISQQYETIIAYINTGKGDFTFDQKVIYEGPHPNWGSTGIQLVDLDGDGDLDVLYSHGDSFDDGVIKPYHGIQWLENKGTYPFTEHTLATMPGVHRALAADIDGDGDLDVVACALLAGGSDVDEAKLPALIWLEQTKRGVFVKHTIEMGFPRHATLDVADIDGDGKVDIITGYMATDKPAKSWVQVWMNQSKR
jgi:VCBS repeat protein